MLKQGQLSAIKNFLNKIKKVYKEKGLFYLIYRSLIVIFYEQAFMFCKSKLNKGFVFQGKKYKYFYHRYNRTWTNERAIEIPIIREILKENKGKEVLEIGNVLSHYFSVNHDIVDKYENAEGVINEDVVNFKPSKKYDLIISISTLEHVGFDEEPKEPEKILRAIENLKNLLSPGGTLIVTLPIGYNPFLDNFLKEGRIRFTKMFFLKRISKDNKWKETKWDEVCDIKYGNPFPYANGIIIGIIENVLNSKSNDKVIS